MAGLGLLILRLVLAVIFFAHGANKVFGLFGGPGIGPGGLTETSTFFAALGLPAPLLLGALQGIIEMLGALLMGVGFFTRAAAATLTIAMGVAIWKVHIHWGFFLNWTGAPGRGQGIEFSLMLIGALVCLLLAGAGELSVDGMNQRSAARDAAGRARLRGKV